MPVAKRSAPAPPLMEWTGWYRKRGGQWQPLCNAPSYDEAWRALYCEMDNGRSGDWMVLRLGKRP